MSVSKSSSNIAWFSPFGENLKSTLLTKEVVPELVSRGDRVIVYVGDQDWLEIIGGSTQAEPGILKLGELEVRHFLRAFQDDRQKKFDFAISNIEDDQRAAFCQISSNRWPGLTLFYDANLNRLEHDKVSHATTGVALDEQLKEKFGEDALKLGDFSIRGWSLEIFDRYLPNGKEEFLNANRALALFENVWQQISAETDCSYYPFPLSSVSELEHRRQRKDARNQKKLPDSSMVFSVFGTDFLRNFTGETVKALSLAFENRGNLEGDVCLLWLVDADQPAALEKLNKILGNSKLGMTVNLCVEQVSSEQDLTAGLLASDLFLDINFDLLRGASFAQLLCRKYCIPMISNDSSLPYTIRPELKEGLVFGLSHALLSVLNEPKKLSQMTDAMKLSLQQCTSVSSFCSQIKSLATDEKLKDRLEEERALVRKQRQNLLSSVIQGFGVQGTDQARMKLFADELE